MSMRANEIWERELETRAITSERLKYLGLLSKQYPTVNSAGTEIINLEAILNLPKGTEHFVSDIHGEFEPFSHVIKNASGVIREYINEIFGNTLREAEKRTLATLVYYPELKLELLKQKETELDDLYRIILYRLIMVCKRVSNKYSRSKVRKSLPKEFAYILEELLTEDGRSIPKEEYYNEIIDAIIRLDRAEDIIASLSHAIQRLAIDHLHIIGDIFDRGSEPDKIMDLLINYHSVDVQWGNHDISWMGAASGSDACICNVIRISAKYNNLHLLEDSYGINLVPLATFAMEYYKGDLCSRFRPEINNDIMIDEKEVDLTAMMHKAISIIQFKVEADIIKRRPEFEMEDRLLLDKINFEKGVILIDGTEYNLLDTNFPTVNKENPFELTLEEKELMLKLRASFKNSEKLQNHVRFLFNKGSMYLIYNSNLLFHGCIPLNEDGSLKTISMGNKKYSGKQYLNAVEMIVREAYFSKPNVMLEGLDLMWYLWCGPDSPLFGKNKMTTFERYFLDDKELQKESYDPYYEMRNNKESCCQILQHFGLEPNGSHIINGHVPVKVKKGESPIKSEGKLIVIDGGFAKAYQKVTGIAGYTLIYRARGLVIVAHEPFESAEAAIYNENDIFSTIAHMELNSEVKKVGNTDIGHSIRNRIRDLELLLYAYRKGILKEKH